MNGNPYHVVHWGLAPKDQRLIEIIFRYAHADRHRLTWGAGASGACDVLIVDTQHASWPTAVAAYRARFPRLIAITVSADGSIGPGPYRIARSHLLAHLIKVVDEALTIEIDREASRYAVTDARTAPPAREARFDCLERDAAAAACTALIVDDSVTVRAQLESALQPLGMNVIQAGSAGEAERLLIDRRLAVDVVLLDVVMPGVDGYQFLNALRKHPHMRRLPVIMLTSRASPFDRARGALAGCDAYLTKPIESARLREVVQKTLVKRPLVHAA